MTIYRKARSIDGLENNVVWRFDGACIPFDPANVDFQQFKQAINEDTAQLEDADGNLMTPNQAKEFIKTLP